MHGWRRHMRFWALLQAAIAVAVCCESAAAQGAIDWRPGRGPAEASHQPAMADASVVRIDPVERPSPPGATPLLTGQWLLDHNTHAAPGDPPYVLRDAQGTVHRFIEPSPRVNLEVLVGRGVRIKHDTGKTLLASQLELSGLSPLSPAGPVASGVQPAQFQGDPSAPIVLDELPPPDVHPGGLGGRPIKQPPFVSPLHELGVAAPHVCGPDCGPGCGDISCGDACAPYGYSSNPDHLAPSLWGLFHTGVHTGWDGLNLRPSFGNRIAYGGWTQVGYHTEQTPLSVTRGDLAAFNDVPSGVRLHQQWLWVGRQARTGGAPDWGFRFDIAYGTDAQKTQAKGNPGAGTPGFGAWDASLDHGIYGWAIPQLYGELAADDWSVIFGHFFTPIGYEVVTAPDNFFYSHSLAMYNSEPFTHTGALATYRPAGNPSGLEIYAGYGTGWDTGFDQTLGGSNFVGGVSVRPASSITLAYIATAGNFGARSNGGSGYTHSIVADVAVTPRLTYVLQHDFVDYNDPTGALGDDQIGVNNYLLYAVAKRWGLGTRLEWWKTDGRSFYEMTYGVNYRPTESLVIRPELRHDWSPAGLPGGSADETTFGIDAVLVY